MSALLRFSRCLLVCLTLGNLASSVSSGGYEEATLTASVSPNLRRLAPAAVALATRHLDPRPVRLARESSASAGPGAGLLGTLSYLEIHKVTDGTRRDYLRRVQEFVDLCILRRWSWVLDEELDAVLVAAFDEMFFRGRPSSDGEKLLAAVKFLLPRFNRMGAGALPRAGIVLLSYSRLRPPVQRLPLPWIVLLAICGIFLARNRVALALKMILSFKAYLRPGESDNLLVKGLVPPTPAAGEQYCTWGLLLHPVEDAVPGKTGLFDEAIPLDDDVCTRLHEFWGMLVQGRPRNAYLWPDDGPTTTLEFNSAAHELQLDDIQPCRYGARHGGASEDLTTHRRTPLGVKRRGRWATDSSLRRYGKETRLLAELAKVHPEVLRYGREIDANLVPLLHGRVPLPRPPALPPHGPAKPKRARR